jgi:hypothetical protein
LKLAAGIVVATSCLVALAPAFAEGDLKNDTPYLWRRLVPHKIGTFDRRVPRSHGLRYIRTSSVVRRMVKPGIVCVAELLTRERLRTIWCAPPLRLSELSTRRLATQEWLETSFAL